MEKAYDPKQTEEKIYQLWSKSGYFNPDKIKGKNTMPSSCLRPISPALCIWATPKRDHY